MKIKLYITICLLFICCISQAQVSVKASKLSATYEAGEDMYFEVTTTASGTIEYFIKFDNRTTQITNGKVKSTGAGTYQIPFTLDEPGFVNCFVVQNNTSDNTAAAFSPFDIDVFEEEPSDFDVFWASAKSQLAAIPIDPVVQTLSSTQYSDTYRVNLANINNRRVYGYLSVPKGTGPFPAILTLPSFGATAGHVQPQHFLAEQGNVLSFTISIHNAEPDQIDPNAYQPNVIDDKDQIYYKQALLGAVRAIDYLFTRSDFDGEHLAVTGVSQGGGLSVCTAGLDDRVKLLVMSISALCQHTGMKYDRPSGHPHYLFNASFIPDIDEEDTNEAIKYYDGTYFARRFKGASMTFVGYEDETCPPATILAAYNQLRNHKVIQHVRDKGHDAPDYFTERIDFFRKYFLKMHTPPSPFIEITTGYHADAGEDQAGSVNTIFTLSGNVEKNGTALTNLTTQWQKIDGPGAVKFSSANNSATTAQFSKAGTYTLRFSATDQSDLASDGEWYTISDHVTITVQ